MVWGGCHWVVALTVVSEVERDAGDECGVGAKLVVLSVIVPCSAVFVVPICQPLCALFPCGEAMGTVGGPEGSDTAVVVIVAGMVVWARRWFHLWWP